LIGLNQIRFQIENEDVILTFCRFCIKKGDILTNISFDCMINRI